MTAQTVIETVNFLVINPVMKIMYPAGTCIKTPAGIPGSVILKPLKRLLILRCPDAGINSVLTVLLQHGMIAGIPITRIIPVRFTVPPLIREAAETILCSNTTTIRIWNAILIVLACRSILSIVVRKISDKSVKNSGRLV